MADNAEIYRVLLQINEKVGKIDGRLDGVDGHVSSVSAKADKIEKKIDDHAKDPDAHGAGTEKQVKKGFIAWAGLGLAGLELVGHWLASLLHSAGPAGPKPH